MATNSVLMDTAVVLKYKVGVDAKGNDILALPTSGVKVKKLAN